jgi:hypothetical protein
LAKPILPGWLNSQNAHSDSRQIVLFVFSILHRTAGASLRQNWIPISLTISLDCRILKQQIAAAEGYRMRPNDKPVVGNMGKRMTRRCVSAATGACR